MPKAQRSTTSQEFSSAAWGTWNQVAVSFYVCFSTMGISNSFGVFQSYYESNLLESYSASTISWIGTTQGFLLSLVSFLSGPLYDKGYVRYLFYVGSALNVVGLLGTSFAAQYATIFLAFGVALGLGCGILYVPAIALVSSHFEETGADLPTAIAMTGSSIGGIVYPILFRQLVQAVGFFSTCRVFAGINGALLLAACLFVKPKEVKKEEEMEEGREDRPRPPLTWRALLDWKLLAFGGLALLMNVGIDVPFYFIPTFVRNQLKLSPEVGDSLLAGLNASSLFGRLFLNWLAEHSNALVVWQFTILITGVLLFWWFTINNLEGIIEFVICYGFVDGGLISLIAPSLRTLYRDEGDEAAFGARLGIVEGLQGVGFLIGPPIAGAILDSPAGYLGVSVFNGTLFFVLSFLVGVFFTRKILVKESSKKEKKDDSRNQLLQPDQPNQPYQLDQPDQSGRLAD
ncbi:MFS general substrate transporter [Hypoxylon rubiginosum]|uniref:MFS general substrate transporter n=1 Tax=Hypoxylon rubiginosum TaxID=110542 RepID=A0ACB9YTL3_9PEZI|nr:MFS general substrate transporter [Hypoxylon rubiginosum]